MKIVSLSFSIAGVLFVIMSALTALEISPEFISVTASFGQLCTTTFFWAGLAVLSFMAGISFGVIAKPEI